LLYSSTEQGFESLSKGLKKHREDTPENVRISISAVHKTKESEMPKQDYVENEMKKNLGSRQNYSPIVFQTFFGNWHSCFWWSLTRSKKMKTLIPRQQVIAL